MMVLLVACGGGGEQATPTASFTPRPSATATLRNTPLPEVPTPLPVGAEEKPIKLAVITEANNATRTLMRDLGETFTDETSNFKLGYYDGLTVEFTLVNNPQEALNTLCGTTDTAVVVDFFTFIAAERRCGAIPAYQIQRDEQMGDSFEIIVRSDRIGSLRQLVRADSSQRNFNFCTMSRTGVSEFIYPAIAFRALAQHPDIESITPTIDLLNASTINVITDNVDGEPFADERELLQALEGGGSTRRCESAVLPTGKFDEILEEMAEAEEEFDFPIELFRVRDGNFAFTNDPEQAIPNPWLEIPYEVLVFPPDTLLPAYLRDEMLRVVGVLKEDDESPYRDLKDLLNADELIEVDAEFYNDYRTYLQNAGWDMAVAFDN